MLRPALLLMISLLLLVASACERARPLTVCARPNAGFLELADGRPAGLELDLLEGFAGAEGRELELTWLDSFGELLPAVESGRCDVGASNVTVTAERAERVDFSEPYFPVRSLLVQRSEDEPLALEDLPGQRIAAVAGTLHVQLLRDRGVVDILEVREDHDLFSAVASGDARALVCDSSRFAQSLDGDFGLMAVAVLGERSTAAFVLANGSPLRERLDASIAQAKADGSYREMLVRHFGEEAASYVLGQSEAP